MKPTRTVKTADTLFDIVEQLQLRDGAGVTELANHLELAKSTVHDHLKTLEHKEYVRKGDGVYRLSLKFLDHGMYAKRSMGIISAVQPSLAQLAETTGELVWFIVEEHGRSVYVEKAVGEHGIQTHGRTGSRTHMHHIAGGKAIMAYLPDAEVRSIVEEHGLPAYTDHTVTSIEDLFGELEQIKEEGIAYASDEAVEGVSCAATPVFFDDQVVGAIHVTGPSARLHSTRLGELPESLESARNEVELKLNYEDGPL